MTVLSVLKVVQLLLLLMFQMNCILLQSNFLEPYSIYIDKVIILIRIFFITLLRTDIALGNHALCVQSTD